LHRTAAPWKPRDFFIETLTITHDHTQNNNTLHATSGPATIFGAHARKQNTVYMVDSFGSFLFISWILVFRFLVSIFLLLPLFGLFNTVVSDFFFFWTHCFWMTPFHFCETHNTRFPFADRIALGINASLWSGAIYPHHVSSYHILNRLYRNVCTIHIIMKATQQQSKISHPQHQASISASLPASPESKPPNAHPPHLPKFPSTHAKTLFAPDLALTLESKVTGDSEA
jgi:hypothetical protein